MLFISEFLYLVLGFLFVLGFVIIGFLSLYSVTCKPGFLLCGRIINVIQVCKAGGEKTPKTRDRHQNKRGFYDL